MQDALSHGLTLHGRWFQIITGLGLRWVAGWLVLLNVTVDAWLGAGFAWFHCHRGVRDHYTPTRSACMVSHSIINDMHAYKNPNALETFPIWYI